MPPECSRESRGHVVAAGLSLCWHEELEHSGFGIYATPIPPVDAVYGYVDAVVEVHACPQSKADLEFGIAAFHTVG